MGSLLPPGEEKLVAREHDLVELEKLSGRRAGALLVGEAGVGKSFLARALAQRFGARGAPVGMTAGLAALRGRPLAALRPLVGGGPSGALDPVEWAAGQLIDLYSGGILLVDDVDQLDEASAAVLHELAHRRGGRPAPWLALTLREGAAPPLAIERLRTVGLVEHVPVPPLDERDVAGLAENLLEGRVDPEVARELWQHARGNPLFARELVSAAWQAGAWAPGDRGWTLTSFPDVSARLEPMLEARLAGLAPPAGQLAEVLALAGALPLELVARLGLGAEVRLLEAAGLARSDGGHTELFPVQFAESLRVRIPTAQRGIWAQRLIDAATDLSVTAGVGVRLTSLALDAGHDLDAEHLLSAASMALSQLDLDAAHDLAVAAQAAARAAREQQLTAAARLVEIQVRAMQGDEDARHDLLETAELAESEPERATARAALARVGMGGGDGPDSALEALGADTAGATEQAIRATALMRQNEWQAATAAATRAVELAETPAEWLAAAAISALLHTWGEDVAAAVGLVRRGLSALDAGVVAPPHVPVVLAQAGTVAAMLHGELELARSAAGLQVPDAPGSSYFEAHRALRTGVLAYYQGSDEAVGLLDRAFSLLHEADPVEVRSWTLAFLARAHAQAGDAPAAREVVTLARTLLQEGQPTAEVELVVAEAWVSACEGDLETAQILLRDLCDTQADRAPVSAALIAVDLARSGDMDGAAARLTGVGDRVGSPVLGAAERLVSAASKHDAQTVREEGAALVESGMRIWAADLMSVAAPLVAEADASSLLARAHAAAAACGQVQTPALRDRRPQLTASQQRVAELAARGLTNRQIGETLGISPRTAATHLHRAYGVLGVNDRDQLTRLLP